MSTLNGDDLTQRAAEVAAQQAGEARLEGCWATLDELEEGEEQVEDPSCAPFCGCTTCIVREVLDAAYPYLHPNPA